MKVAIRTYLNKNADVLQALRESRKGSKHSPLLSKQTDLQKAVAKDICKWIDDGNTFIFYPKRLTFIPNQNKLPRETQKEMFIFNSSIKEVK